jgi:hypothetical protein
MHAYHSLRIKNQVTRKKGFCLLSSFNQHRNTPVYRKLSPIQLSPVYVQNLLRFSRPGRRDELISSLLSSSWPPFFLFIMAFVAFSLEVSPAIFTSSEILSILYDLFCPAMKPQGFGFSNVPVPSSYMFAGFSPRWCLVLKL